MNIKPNDLKELLEIDGKDLERLSVEQLRLLLGVAHYTARLAQREINLRLGGFNVDKKV